MHISRGLPLISALHEPHLPALQFQRTARSGACVAWMRWMTSSTTMPSSTGDLVFGEAAAAGVAAPDPHRELAAPSSVHGYCSSKMLLQLVGHLGQAVRWRDGQLAVRLARDELIVPEASVRRRGNRRGCGRRGSPCARSPSGVHASETVQHRVQVERQVPARVVLAVAAHTVTLSSRFLSVPISSSACIQLRLRADDADQVLHAVLQVAWIGVGVLAADAARTAPASLLRDSSTWSSLTLERAAWNALAYSAASRPARRPKTSRSESELPPRRLAPCRPAATSPAANRPGHGRGRGLSVDAHAAHDVVAGRADLHRLVGDVDVGQLHELLVHRRQPALDVVGDAARGDVEEDAAMRAAPAGLDLGVDRAGHLVAREQVGRAAVVASCPRTSASASASVSAVSALKKSGM